MTGDLIGALNQGRQHIGELLVNLKKIDRNQLDAALGEQAKLNSRLGEVLVAQGHISQQDLDHALAIQNNRNPQAPMLARKMLGDLLLDTGKLTTAQLQAALETQNLTQQKIGEVLLEMGFVSQRDIDSALRVQDSLAFSSRQRILDRLESRSASEAAAAKQRAPLPAELAQAFPNRGRFMDAAAQSAFASAFGRAMTPQELTEWRTKLTFVYPEGARLSDSLPADFNRSAALQRLSAFFQNVIAERITQLAGGDSVQKKFDRLGNVEVTGLSPRDLEIAIEVVTGQGFDPQIAAERFLEQSPRAFFRAMVGRDFASDTEEALFQQLLDGPQAASNRDALRRLQGLLRDTFASYPLARSDKAIRASLTPDEQEIKELLEGLRKFSEREALRLFQEKEWWYRKLELAAQTEGMLRNQLDTIKAEQQIKKIMDLIERLLGRLPPGLMKLIKQMVGMAGSGAIPNMAALEQMILNLFEQVLQRFSAKMGRNPSPDELAQAMEMVLGDVAGGGKDPLAKLDKQLDVLKEGKSPQGGLSLDKAIALVNTINFEYKGQFSGSVDAQDPWVLALFNGDQSAESMREAFRQYYKDGKQGIGLPEALAFVEFMNLSYKGIKLDADPFDPYVQKLLTGEMSPGEVDREWRSIFRGEPEAALA